MSGNRNLDRGKQWERDVRDYLREHGIDCHRQALLGQHARQDKGDLACWGAVGEDEGGYVVAPAIAQCKNAQSRRLRTDLVALGQQRDNAGVDYGVLVYKEARKPTGQAIVVMPLETFAQMYGRLITLERNRITDAIGKRS